VQRAVGRAAGPPEEGEPPRRVQIGVRPALPARRRVLRVHLVRGEGRDLSG